MINLDLAKELKEAGLEWEPQVGDWFSGDMEYPMLVAFKSSLESQYTKITNGKTEHFPDSQLLTGKEMMQADFTWLPRLDQLLSEIERRGYGWELMKNSVSQYFLTLNHDSDNSAGWDEEEFEDTTPETAAAQALLWILKEGNHVSR